MKLLNDRKNRIYFFFTLLILSAWVIQLITPAGTQCIVRFGILPQSLQGLPGIFFSPFLHSGYAHLFSNTVPLLLMGASVIYFYSQSSLKTLLIIYILSGSLVWIFGRTQAWHIGASGLVYGLGTFLLVSGIIRRDARSAGLVLLIVFIYGSMVWGLLPYDVNISYESHIAGAVSGLLSAVLFRKLDPPKRYDWEDEKDDGQNGGEESDY